MTDNLLCKLVGLTKEEQPLAAYLASLNSHPQTKRFADEKIYYDKYLDLGIAFMFEEPHEVLECIYLYAGGVQGYEEYNGNLPNSLRFADTRQDVLQRLGQPNESGGNEYVDLLNKVIPPWDNYDMEGYILNITYGRSEERISMVAIMPLPKG